MSANRWIESYKDPLRGWYHRCVLCTRRDWQETGEVLVNNGFTPAGLPLLHLPRCPADPDNATPADPNQAVD